MTNELLLSIAKQCKDLTGEQITTLESYLYDLKLRKKRENDKKLQIDLANTEPF
jgi:hypothetical protein